MTGKYFLMILILAGCAATETDFANASKTCQAMGLPTGGDAFERCVVTQVEQAVDRRKSIGRAIGEGMQAYGAAGSAAAARPAPANQVVVREPRRMVQCTTRPLGPGTHVTCY